MRSIGINVVRKDASWVGETDTLLDTRRTPQCDMEVCRCPFGRKHDQPPDPYNETPWELLLCDSCNSNGTHAECGNMTYATDEQCENWLCPVCAKILADEANQAALRQAPQAEQQTTSNESPQSSSSSDDEDSEEAVIGISKGTTRGKRKVSDKLLYEKHSKYRVIEVPDDDDDEGESF